MYLDLIIKYDGLNHGSINGVWKDLGSYNNDGTITGASYDEKTGGFIFNGNNYVSSKRFDEDEFTTEITSGTLKVNYVTEEGTKLAPTTITTDLVGKTYETEKKYIKTVKKNSFT